MWVLLMMVSSHSAGYLRPLPDHRTLESGLTVLTTMSIDDRGWAGSAA